MALHVFVKYQSVLREYSPYLDRELEEVKYFDAGDIPLPFGNAQRSLDMIEEYVSKLLDADEFPPGLGGDALSVLAEFLRQWQKISGFSNHPYGCSY